MKLRPLLDRVVVKDVETEEVSKGGILLTTAGKEKPQFAEVVAVGPGGTVDGKEVKILVSVGERVVYSQYAGTRLKLEGEDYIVLKQSDILAVIE